MRSAVVLATVLTAALSFALPAVEPWKPATSTVECDATEPAIISFATPQGYSNGTDLAVAACKALDPCLYDGDNRPDDVVCVASNGISKRTIDHSLNEAISGCMDIVALDPTNKTPKTMKIDLSPPANPTQPETYRKEDCEGYLSQFFSQKQGSGGCADETNDPHMGKLTVGSPSTLSGAVFKVSFVK